MSPILILILYLITGSGIAILAVKVSSLDIKDVGALAMFILTLMWPAMIIMCIYYAIMSFISEGDG